MEDGKMSVQELLKLTAEELEGILVPVKYADEISRPLCRAVYNLRTCISAMETPEKPEEQEEKTDV